MRTTILVLIFVTAAVSLFVISCDNGKTASAATAETMSNDVLIKRGDYLVNSIGCDDCHSPKKWAHTALRSFRNCASQGILPTGRWERLIPIQ